MAEILAERPLSPPDGKEESILFLSLTKYRWVSPRVLGPLVLGSKDAKFCCVDGPPTLLDKVGKHFEMIVI